MIENTKSAQKSSLNKILLRVSFMERNEIISLVSEHLSTILEIDASKISEGDSFIDDLEADSLALIELVELLEEDLSSKVENFRIEDEDMEGLKTVRDAVDYIKVRVDGQA